MIFTGFMIHTNKLVNQYYIVVKRNDKIIVDIVYKYDGIIKVPVHTSSILFNEILYVPFVFTIINDYILTPYVFIWKIILMINYFFKK